MGCLVPFTSKRHPLVRSHCTWRTGILKPIQVATSCADILKYTWEYARRLVLW